MSSLSRPVTATTSEQMRLASEHIACQYSGHGTMSAGGSPATGSERPMKASNEKPLAGGRSTHQSDLSNSGRGRRFADYYQLCRSTALDTSSSDHSFSNELEDEVNECVASSTSRTPRLSSTAQLQSPSQTVIHGRYSVVQKCICIATGRPFVAKMIRLNGEGYNPEEADLLRGCRHPNIVRLVDVFEQEESIILVMPFIDQGELFCKASTVQDPLSERHTANYLFQLLDSLAYLHENGVVHRDVKLENLMLSSHPTTPLAELGRSASSTPSTAGSTPPGGKAKSGFREQQRSESNSAAASSQSLGTPSGKETVSLIDFGFSKMCGVGQRILSSCCGSPHYMSPEMLKASRNSGSDALPSKNRFYGPEVDIWAAGVAMYVLLFGQYPFHDERHSQWHRKILEGKYEIPEWRRQSISDEALHLLSSLLEVNVGKRLTAIEALQHPWFVQNGLDWSTAAWRTAAPIGLAPRKKSPPGGTLMSGARPATHTESNAAASTAIPCATGEPDSSTADGSRHSPATLQPATATPNINAVAFTPPRSTHRLVGAQLSPF